MLLQLFGFRSAQAKQMMALAAVQHRPRDDAPSLLELEALKQSHQVHARRLLSQLQHVRVGCCLSARVLSQHSSWCYAQAKRERQRNLESRIQARAAASSRKLAWQGAEEAAGQDVEVDDAVASAGEFAATAARILEASTAVFADALRGLHEHVMPEASEDVSDQLVRKMQAHHAEGAMQDVLQHLLQPPAPPLEAAAEDAVSAAADDDTAHESDVLRLREVHSSHNKALLQALDAEKQRLKARLSEKLRRRQAIGSSRRTASSADETEDAVTDNEAQRDLQM